MNEIIIYVEKAFENVAGSERKAEMVQEIIGRIEDSACEWIKNGKDRDDAINKSIVEFGDLTEIILELRGEPLGLQFDNSKRGLWFSIIGSLIFVALMVFINMYYSPNYIWFLYPTFAVIWWPLSMFFFGKWRKGRN